MAVKIGSLLIRLAVEHGLLQEGLAIAEKDVAKTTKAIQRRGREIADFGKNLSLAVSVPMAAIAKSAVDGFIEQEKAMADVRAALTSMGSASGKTATELAKTADQLEMRSLFDAEVILKQVTAQLLTFGNVAGREFDRAQQAAVDMATRLGGEPQAAAIMLGKALNDPVKGIAALTRVGVQFTDAQKAQIRAMTEAGDVAGAQGVILAEVERQFRGAAQAAADASPWRQAQVAIGQAMDAIGAAILPAIKPAGEAIAALARAFAGLPEGAQQVIVVAGVLAAALGPVLIVLGSLISASAGTIAMFKGLGLALDVGGLIKNLIPIIGQLGRALVALVASNPLLAALAVAIGLAFVAWQNWDKIKPIIDRVVAAISGFWAERVSPVLAKLKDGLFGAVGWWLALKDGALKAIAQLVSGVKDWIVGRLGEVWDNAKRRIDQVKGDFFELYDAVVGNSYVPDMVDEIGQHMARLDGLMVDPARKAAKNTADAMREMARETQAILAEAFPEDARRFELAKKLSAFDGVADQLGLSDNDRSRGRLNLQGNTGPGELSPQLQRLMASVSDEIEMIPIKLGETAEKTRIATVQIAENMRDMAERSIQALDRMVGAIKGGDFLDILGSAVNLFLQLGSTGLFGKTLQTNINAPRIPANANGTAFHPGGLMKVGERGPEILQVPRGGRVIPNHELREASMSAAAARITVGIDPRNGNITAFVNGQIAQTAPAIASGGATIAQAQIAQRALRKIR